MNYRCYHINNFYLGGIHAGIQSAHAQHELAMKYLSPDAAAPKTLFNAPAAAAYVEWATNHKTIIVLNGGMQSDLRSWVGLLSTTTHPHAWAEFEEAEEALNGALTNIALVLPEYVYAYASEVTKALNAPMGVKHVLHRLEDGADCVVQKLDNGNVVLKCSDGDELLLSAVDVDIMEKLSKCRLM